MTIPIRKLFFLLLFLMLIIVAMSFFPKSLSWTIYKRLDLNSEANIPTWFSTILLFCVSLTSFIIYVLHRNVKNHASVPSFWLGFSAVYCFLSLDEAAQLHEMFDTGLHIKWIYVYAPFAAIFFIVCSRFLILINKNKYLRNWIIGGLIVYALGGLIGESFDYFFFPSRVEIVLEEGFEMFGTILVFVGCIQELNRCLQSQLSCLANRPN